MDSKKRYKQLIEENNNSLELLSDDYKIVGTNYLKKARGYAVKNQDTELKIKETLSELYSFDESNADFNSSIKDMTSFIEERIKLLSKAPTIKFRVQEIIAVSIFILCIVGYFVINKVMNKPTPLAKPQNVEATIIDNYFILSWDKNGYAKEGYIIYVYKDDVFIAEKHIDYNIDSESQKQIAELKDVLFDSNYKYTFKIITNKTEQFAQSEAEVFNYPVG